jgi:hypothetical protein
MSKIEVNTVEPQCGTTLTVGKCTTNLRSGGNSLQAADGGNLISQSGTDITLGASGDTINLASGASQSGFGRTGTVDWVTTVKVTGDSPITAVTGEGYFLNTTAGTITVNLPAGAAGSIVSVADYTRTWNSNNVTIAPNGVEKIGGVAADATLNVNGQSATFVYVDGTEGWINVQETQTSQTGISFITGTVSGSCNTLTTAPDCANVKVAKFVGPGTFCVSQIASCAPNNVVSHMVVAGGGSGGGEYGGGGGAGGFRETKSPVTPYTASPLCGSGTPANIITVTATCYPITVGAGGASIAGPTPCAVGNPGNASTFSTIPSAGGGGGRWNNDPCGVGAGGSGGGGGGGGPGLAGVGNTPPVTPAQGTPGGVGGGGTPPGGSCAPAYGRGGGGGAGVAGSNGSSTIGGAGGNGVTTSIDSTPTVRGGGGGGGIYQGPHPAGAGGSGGGGAGSPGAPAGVNGTINTGGGGGGQSYVGGTRSGAGGGGSGIVIIRYKFQ